MDLYDINHIVFSDRIDDDHMIVAISHSITPSLWMVELEFEAPDIVLEPVATPSVASSTPVNPPFRNVYRSANQSIPNATITTVAHDSNAQTFVGITASAGVYTVNLAGVYLITANNAFAANSTGQRSAYVKINGVQKAEHTKLANAQGNYGIPVSLIWKCDAGDTIEIAVYQSSGGSLALNGGVELTNAQIYRLGD
jgi:hypothetical protein